MHLCTTPESPAARQAFQAAFADSHCRHFQDAVKRHQAYMMEQLAPRYEPIGAGMRENLQGGQNGRDGQNGQDERATTL